MNCQEFAQRLQQRLDERRRPEQDSRLRRHADRCLDCRLQLRAWQQIDQVMPSPAAARRRRSLVVCGLAAAILLAIGLRSEFGKPDGATPVRVVARRAADAIDGPSPTRIAAEIDPRVWWYDVRGRDWLAQTMPAVRRVREGVAPLGRSLLQAVTILTTGGGEQHT